MVLELRRKPRQPKCHRRETRLCQVVPMKWTSMKPRQSPTLVQLSEWRVLQEEVQEQRVVSNSLKTGKPRQPLLLVRRGKEEVGVLLKSKN